MFSRDQLKRAATLTEEDFVQLGKCRRPHNRLGFAYQVAFVRLFDRFPHQQPFELFEELVCFSAAQLRLDARLIELYRKRQPTISEHQQTITGYLKLRAFDDAEAAQLEQFLFEDSCRLEQASALMGRAREFLKEQRVLEPAEIRIARIVGEQRARAREHILSGLPRQSRTAWRAGSRTCSWSNRMETAPACRRSKPTPASHPWMRCSLYWTN
jgi:hypothetical protein